MATYTVKSGDTLSAIAAKYGVDYTKITGYKSGNPNLIYAGETLNIPDAAAPATQTPTVTQPKTTTPTVTNNNQDPHINPATGVWDDNYYAQTQKSSIAAVTKPTIDLNKLYEANYNSADIKSAQSEVDAANAELDKLMADRDAAVANEGDNPFFAQATLSGKTSKINDKYSAEATRIQNKVTTATNKLATLKSDAQIKTNIALQQYQIDSQDYQSQISQLNALFNAGGLINASDADIASYATATGLPVAQIKSVIAQQKQAQVKPQVITATDDSGNMTVTVIDANTGKTITQNSLGKIDKSKTTATTTADKNAYYMEALRQDAARGMELSSVFKVYSGYLDPNTILNLYNSNSMYGPAKESADQLAKYGVKPVSTPFSITNVN